MASGKQNQPQGQPQPGQRQPGQHNGGAGAGAQGAQGQIREAARNVQERAGEFGSQAREAVAHRYRRAEGLFARNPSQSVLIGFGLGFGIGLALTMLLGEDDRPWYERQLDEVRRARLPRSLRNLPDQLSEAGEAIGRYIPSSLGEAGEAIGRYIPSSFRR